MIKKIQLKNFRLFEEINLETNNSLVILCGDNATGKTSILEAIYLCSTTKSHRTTNIDALIKAKADFALALIEEKNKYKVVVSKKEKKKLLIVLLNYQSRRIELLKFQLIMLLLVMQRKNYYQHQLKLQILSILDSLLVI